MSVFSSGWEFMKGGGTIGKDFAKSFAEYFNPSSWGRSSSNMSDSHMFTKNKMPDGYDQVWLAFGRAWLKKDKDEEQTNTK